MQRVDVLFQAIRELPERERLRLVERVIHELAEPSGSSSSAEEKPGAAIFGLWAGEEALVDDMVAGIMQERETRRLRTDDE